MKAQTAAKKLNIYLPATPKEFQDASLSHEEFVALQDTPPQWLQTLRLEGPYPRPEVARKLGVTITALKANDADHPLTASEIKALLENQPEWLRTARTALATRRATETKGQNATADSDAS